MQAKSVVVMLAVFLVACGASETPKSDGEKAYVASCLSCHSTGAVGDIGPNITFSTTAGIAAYTEADFLKLVRSGVNKKGTMTCATMTRFSATALSDAKVQLIYAYLQTLKNDTVNGGSACQ